MPKSRLCDIVELPLDPSGAGLWDEGQEHDDLISLGAPGFGVWGLKQVLETLDTAGVWPWGERPKHDDMILSGFRSAGVAPWGEHPKHDAMI